ncbi:MAG: hypothetical protein J3K34DRAFT_468267, partial [Monoraphidium minutum]
MVGGYELLQAMAMLPLPNNALLALPEVADLILSHAAVDVAGIAAFVEGDPACAALLAAAGGGADALERAVVMRGPEWAAPRAGEAPGRRLSIGDAAAQHGLPRDLAALHQEAGVRSFEVLAIGPPGGTPLGALIVGRRAAWGFGGGGGAEPPAALAAAATGLLQLLRRPCVVQAAGMLRSVAEAPDAVASISALLQGTRGFMWRSANLAMTVRLALFVAGGGGSGSGSGSGSAGGGGSGECAQEALIFEATPVAPFQRRRHDSVSSSGNRSGPVSSDSAAASVSVRQMPLEGTLLARALALRQAYVVKDAAMYMQSCGTPARDLLSACSSVATSLAVVPMLLRDEPFGAMYFCASTPIDFTNVQETLLGVVPPLTLALAEKLQGHMGTLQGLVTEARQSLDLPLSGPVGSAIGGAPCTPALMSAAAPAAPSPAAAAPSAATPEPAPPGPRGAALKQLRRGWGDGADTGSSSGGDAAAVGFCGARASAGGGATAAAPPRSGGGGGCVPPGLIKIAARCDDDEGDGGGSGGAPAWVNHDLSLEPAPPLAHAPRARHMSAGSGGGGGAAGPSSQLLLIPDVRQCVTESMVMVLQDEIRRSRASCSLELSFMSDLTLVREIGRGGFGTVYSGFWRKMPAAIKAMHARVDDGEAVSDAMEIAVLSSVHHPNIVQLYSCLLGMALVEDEDASASASFCCPDAAEAQPPPRFTRTRPGEAREPGAGSYNLIVMELCDRGSLRDAVRRGAFHRRVRHDEALSVHGDVKLDNVLLKSDASTRWGTVTHLAPELLIRGSEITPAVDVFSFGILMFELFAATQPYA